MKSRARFFLAVIVLVTMHQWSMSQQDNPFDDHVDNKATMIETYIRLATSIAYKGYKFFTRDIIDYDLQVDVLDIPYKKMIYLSTQAIEELFDHANRHDNPMLQIQAVILLCRMPIPEWYLKSYHKGLDELYELCFDEDGNFVDASGIHDIRLIFKDYYRKAPSTGQEIAVISDWWCKNKKPYPMYTKYYAATCTDYNEELLEMTQVDQLEQLVYLKYLLQKNGSVAARKIHDYQVSRFFKAGMIDIDVKK